MNCRQAPSWPSRVVGRLTIIWWLVWSLASGHSQVVASVDLDTDLERERLGMKPVQHVLQNFPDRCEPGIVEDATLVPELGRMIVSAPEIRAWNTAPSATGER